jgi:IS4 transposase
VQNWAAEEVATARLGDQRLNQRLATMVTDFTERAGESVPDACASPKATKAAYRFWDNPSVTHEAILQAHSQATAQRALQEEVVLAVQDTTEVDFTHIQAAAKDLGYLDSTRRRGFKLHSVLAVSPDGVPLGVLHQRYWTRDVDLLDVVKDRKRKLQDKESIKWIDGLHAAEKALPEQKTIVVVSDAESDIFDLFIEPRRSGCHLLVRLCRLSRLVDDPLRNLDKALRARPVQGTYTLEVPTAPDRTARQATLTVRYMTATLRPPKNHPQRSQLEPVTLQLVLVEEENAPEGEEPICWFLATTLPVESLEDARRVILWYSYRWRVERFHYVFKSGCRVEKLQLERGMRLLNAIATFTIVAWRLLWLTYQARKTPDASCETVFKTEEWQVLFSATHDGASPPSTPPTLSEAVAMIGLLGGHMGRRLDGPPGVKTLWRGLRRLHDLALGWLLGQEHRDQREELHKVLTSYG